MTEQKNNRSLRLLLGCGILLVAGIIYAWSILNKPLQQSFSKTELSFCFTLTLCFFCLGGLVSGLISNKVSIFIRMILAAVCTGLGFTLSAVQNGNLLLLYLGYGVLAGSGIGIVYNTVIAATNAWFPDKKGLCSGALMMCFGFSALVFGQLADKLFAVETFGWQRTYQLLGAVAAVVFIAGAWLLKMPAAAAKKQLEDTDGDVPTRDMIRRISFWKLFVFFTLLAAVGSAAIGFGKDYFLSVGLAENAAVTVAGLLSIFNGLGRIVSGMAFDRLGLRKTQILTSAVAIVSPLLALLAVVMNAGWLGVIGLCLCGFTYGFSPTMSAALIAAFYGGKYFPLNFPVLNLVLIPASFSSTLAGALVTASGNYLTVFVVLTALSVVGLFVNLSIKKA